MGRDAVMMTNTSGTTGVHYHKPSDLWRAQIWRDGKNVTLGYFGTSEAAAACRRKADIAKAEAAECGGEKA